MSPYLSQEIVILAGTYYTPLWIAPRTNNVGFIAALELISDTKSGAKLAQLEYANSFWRHWNLKPVGRPLKLTMHTDRELYPLFKITNGDHILPFACVSGPMFDEQIKLKVVV